MRRCSVFRLAVAARRATAIHLGWIALGLTAACTTGDSAPMAGNAIDGSATPCRFQEWARAQNLASNPYLSEALAPASFMNVPSGFLPLADGSGHFIAIEFDGTQTRQAVLVVFTCDGEHVLTERFGPRASIEPFSHSQATDAAPSYVTVDATREDPRRERTVRTYYRFFRNRLTPVGQLVKSERVLEDSLSGIQEVVTRWDWRADEPNLISRCVETRRVRRDSIAGSWRIDSLSRRAVAQVHRLEKDKLRLVSREDGC